MKTIQGIDLSALIGLPNNFSDSLTIKLDAVVGDFDQNIINEIVLWKVSRYTNINESTLNKLNSISPASKELNKELTIEVLKELLATRGIRLPMASTILRFRNPNVYQIIDQRVYRIIYGKELVISTVEKKNTEMYLAYLLDLRKVCDKYEISFNTSDRTLYELDKKINKNIKY